MRKFNVFPQDKSEQNWTPNGLSREKWDEARGENWIFEKCRIEKKVSFLRLEPSLGESMREQLSGLKRENGPSP